MIFALPDTVWQNGKIIEQSGFIDKHTKESDYINGGYYLKTNCTFTIKQSG